MDQNLENLHIFFYYLMPFYAVYGWLHPDKIQPHVWQRTSKIDSNLLDIPSFHYNIAISPSLIKAAWNSLQKLFHRWRKKKIFFFIRLESKARKNLSSSGYIDPFSWILDSFYRQPKHGCLLDSVLQLAVHEVPDHVSQSWPTCLHYFTSYKNHFRVFPFLPDWNSCIHHFISHSFEREWNVQVCIGCFQSIHYVDDAFRSLDDSFVVVVTMLLGELDWGLAIESHENVMVTRLVFLLFIMMMSIVLINLVIGLSISDISSLRYSFILYQHFLILFVTFRKEAHIHKLINTVSAIKSVENLHQLLWFIFPSLKYNTQVTNNSSEYMLDDQVTFRFLIVAISN